MGTDCQCRKGAQSAAIFTLALECEDNLTFDEREATFTFDECEATFTFAPGREDNLTFARASAHCR